jgi:predicted esterase
VLALALCWLSPMLCDCTSAAPAGRAQGPRSVEASPGVAASGSGVQATSDADRSDPEPGASKPPSLEALDVPGFLPAVLYVPPGAEPRPLVVTAHGAGGIPEAECEYWVGLTRGRAFVLSLRGTPFNAGAPSAFFYRSHLELGRELGAALSAAQQRFGARFAPGAGVYSGFSQGATMGVGMIPEFAETLPHLVLIEGGYNYWSVAHARKYRVAGGKRVLIACGTEWCFNKASEAAEWQRQAGLEARVEYAPGAGHTPYGQVLERVRAALPGVLKNVPAWSFD